MKMDLSKQTKYFKKIFNHDVKEFQLIEIPLNRDNWFYVQVDATIRTIFLKYNFSIPKYIIVEELGSDNCKHIIFNVFKNTIENENEALRWVEKWYCVFEELKHQAECNSYEPWEDTYTNYTKYEFKLL
jgi:hypothetical protein